MKKPLELLFLLTKKSWRLFFGKWWRCAAICVPTFYMINFMRAWRFNKEGTREKYDNCVNKIR